MSILDRFRAKKGHYKRTSEEIKQFKVLNTNQLKIIESYRMRCLASEQESKALRATLFNLDDMQSELGIDAFENNNTSSVISNGQFNFSDLIVKVLKGLNHDTIIGGKNTISAASDFVASQSNEINALASHQLKGMLPKLDNEKVIP
jgi:hypothetical protein